MSSRHHFLMHLPPTFNPCNKCLKLSDSPVHHIEQRPQPSVCLPCTTHGTKTSNQCLTPMYNPWNKDLKPVSDSHVQPMERRPQTGIQLPSTTHTTKSSNSPTPIYNPRNKDIQLTTSQLHPIEQ